MDRVFLTCSLTGPVLLRSQVRLMILELVPVAGQRCQVHVALTHSLLESFYDWALLPIQKHVKIYFDRDVACT